MAIHRFFAETENARRLARRLAAGRPKDALALALGERRSGLICARPDQLARRSERDRTDDLGRMEHLDRDFGVGRDCKRASPGRFAGEVSRNRISVADAALRSEEHTSELTPLMR